MRLALPLLVAALAGPASAFELSKTSSAGPYIHLPQFPLGFAVAPGDPALSRAAREALETWASAPDTAVSVRFEGEAPQVKGDGRTTVAGVSPWPFGDTSRVIAHTEVLYSTTTGTISEGDVVLNAEGFAFGDGRPGTVDQVSVILHESGHTLGLGHSCGDPGTSAPSCFSIEDRPRGRRDRLLAAVMAPSLAPGTRRRALGADDREALATLYPGVRGASVSMGRVLDLSCTRQIKLEAAAGYSVRLRTTLGSTRALSASVAVGRDLLVSADAIAPGEDLLLDDPRTGGHGFLIGVALEPGPGCPPQPLADDAPGCACAETRGSAPSYVGWMLLVAALGLRSRRMRAWATAAIAVMVGLAPAPALAYKCTRTGGDSGPSLIWSSREVGWVADARLTADIADQGAALDAMKAAFGAWTDADCSDFHFALSEVRANAHAEAKDGGPYENVVVFDAIWPYEKGIIGLTTNAYDAQTGQLFDSDIELNDEHFTFVLADQGCTPRSGVTDLQNTLTHEAGHMLGLDHPPNRPEFAEATMFASAPPCETDKRSLARDDIEGLCRIYPAGKVNDQCYPPDAPSFIVVSTDPDLGGCSAIGGRPRWELAPLLLLLYRGRRGRRGLKLRG